MATRTPRPGEWFERKVAVLRAAPDLPRDAKALLAAVLAAPDDDAPRLVYADWLLEQGDPRGEFIAVQCELASLGQDEAARATQLRAREAELLAQHKKDWVGHFPGSRTEYGIVGGKTWVKGSPTKWTFERGFVRWVAMQTQDLVANAEGLFASEPVYGVHLTDPSVQLLVEQCPSLERLRLLDLSRVRLKEQGARSLFGARRFAALEVLDLTLCGLGVKGTQAAIDACDPAAFPRLRTLRLWENSLGDKGTLALSKWPLLGLLSNLELGKNRIGEKGGRALAESPFLERIEELSLVANALGDAEQELRARFGSRVRFTFSDP